MPPAQGKFWPTMDEYHQRSVLWTCGQVKSAMPRGAAPVVWSLAAHHADRCVAVANLCVPYIPGGFVPDNLIPLVNRDVYPVHQYPAGQWDYQLYHLEQFEQSRQALEADVRATVKALMRRGDPAGAVKPSRTASFRADGGWFSGAGRAPDLPMDETVLDEEALCAYVTALGAHGFTGPNAWYANPDANRTYAQSAPKEGRLELSVLFLHAAYDWVCDTQTSRLVEPMRSTCTRLAEVTVESGHWMQQERPQSVNAALLTWIHRERLAEMVD